MKQSIIVMVALLAGAAIGGGFVLQANSQSVPPAAPNPFEVFILMDKPMLPDIDGRPDGVAQETWFPVTDELGAIWTGRSEGTDVLTWVVRKNGYWLATEPAKFDHVYRYRQGS